LGDQLNSQAPISVEEQKLLDKIIAWLWSAIQGILNSFTKSKRTPFIFGMSLLTAGVFGWLIYRQRNIFLNFHGEFRPLPILFSFLFYTIIQFLVAFIWGEIMNRFGGKVKFNKHFRFFCISALGKRLPGTVWYIPWRAKMYDSLGITLGLVSIASGVELAVQIISGLLVTLFFAIPILYRYQASLWVGVALFIFCLFILHPKVLQWTGQRLKLDLGRIGYRTILSWIMQYTLCWIIGGFMYYCVVNIFIPVPISQIIYIIGAWTLTGALSLSLFILPSNFGFNEISLSLLLSLIIPSPVAVIVAVGGRILLFTYELLWAGAMILLEYRGGRKLTP
jgi:glycosyltransferase 2 family protein